MRSVSRMENRRVFVVALVAAGLGLGAVAGFFAGLARERRDFRAALKAARSPRGGRVPAPRAERGGIGVPPSFDQVEGMGS